IDSYVAGRLGEKEAEQFEDYCLAHPEFARQVEAEQLLKAGLTRVARDTPRALAAPRAMAWQWPVALAASLVAVCGLALYAWGPGNTHPSVLLAASVADKPVSDRVLRLAMVRSATEDAPLLPSGRARIEVAALFDTAADYTVMLFPVSDTVKPIVLGALEHQRTASGTALPLLIDGDSLQPGAYLLRIQRADGGDEPLEFVF